MYDFNSAARQDELVEPTINSPDEVSSVNSIPEFELKIDKEEIRQFTNALFRYADPGNYVSVRAFSENEPDPRKSVFKIEAAYIDAKGIEAVIDRSTIIAQQAASETRPTVFCPPIATFKNHDDPKKAREIDLAQTLALSVECDQNPDKARKQLEALLGPASVVVRSGGEWVDPETGEIQDKLHLHWRLTEPTSVPDDHKVAKEARALATALVGGDATNIPAVHPIRWPGSWHRKGEPRIAKIISLNENAEIDLSDALDLLHTSADAVGVSVGKTFSNDKGEYQGGDSRNTDLIVQQVITGENYHQSLVTLAMRYLKGGMPDGQAILVLRGHMEASKIFMKDRDGWNNQRWQARYDTIPHVVNSARNKLEIGHQSSNLSLLSVEELLRLPPPEYLIEGILPDRGVAFLGGASGVMKSFLALLFSFSVAFGRNVGKLKVKSGNTLYLLNEGQAGFGLRCQAFLNYNSLTSPDTFKAITVTPNLMRSHEIDPFIEVIDEANFNPNFIILDTFSKAIIGGNDNATDDVSVAIDTAYKLADKYGALVLIIDHVGKDPKRGLRGAYAKYGNVDAVVMVSKPGDNIVSVTTTKQKEGEDNLKFYFDVKFSKVTHPINNLTSNIPVLVPTQPNITQKEFVLDYLEQEGASARESLQEAFVNHFGENTRKSFDTVLDRLKKAREVKVNGDIIEACDDE